MLKKLPIPIAGVMLGLAALGNLLQSYSESVRLFCGALSALLGILLIGKLVLYPKAIKEAMKDPVIASVSGTFSMALMLLSVYLKPYIGSGAVYIWYFAIVIHMMLIVYFTFTFIFKLFLGKVFPSYFIVYVGLATASISSPAFNKQALGRGILYFAMATLIALMILVTLRYIRCPEIPNPAKPLFCIYAAPISLCLAGYIQAFESKSSTVVVAMAIAASILYLIVLVKMPKLLKLPFYPSYAAFTFPFVISAIAIKQSTAFLGKVGLGHPVLSYVVLIETILAAILVAYAFIRYVIFLVADRKEEKVKS